MRIGILADIHEHLDYLKAAIRKFEESQVDRTVQLGDVFDTGRHIRETVELLHDAGAEGVWGNHDLGLCCEPDPEFISRYDTTVIEYFGSLAAHFELEGVLFSHGNPTWDATDPTVYYLGDKPWELRGSLSVFATFSHEVFLIGHHHRWHLSTEEGPQEWDGTRPLVLNSAERHLLVVHALCRGWCAIFDTDTREFQPCFLGKPRAIRSAR